MGNIGDDISQPIPAVGTSGTAYATQINAFLTEVKTRLEAAIPLSSLLLSSLDMQNSPITNAAYLGLISAAGAPTGPVGSFHSFGGNAYFVGLSGAVQITDGSNLNVAATGGITGDYGGANPAQFRFVDADKVFYAYDDYPLSQLGYLRALGMEVAPSATSAQRIRLAWGGSASYTLTFPPSAPAAGTFLQMSAAGAITASQSTGVDLTLTGSADLKHGDKTLVHELESYAARTESGTVALPNVAAGHIGAIISASTVTRFPIRGLRAGDRIKSVSVHHGGSAASVQWVLETNAGTSWVTVPNTTNTASTPATVTVATPTAITTSPYYLKVTTGAGSCAVYRVVVTFDRP